MRVWKEGMALFYHLTGDIQGDDKHGNADDSCIEQISESILQSLLVPRGEVQMQRSLLSIINCQSRYMVYSSP